MSKSKNKILTSILAVLIAIFLATNYFKKNSDTKLKTNIVDIDTSQVSKIQIIKPMSDSDKIIFTKSLKDWKVSKDSITSDVNSVKINSILNVLNELKIERLVAKSKDKWRTYQLQDSIATKVSIESKNGKTINLHLGKSQYKNPTNQYNQYNIISSTYIRVNGGSEIYSVKGMLLDVFNRDFNEWRNPEFLKVDNNYVTQIQFENSKDISFLLRKQDSIWKIGSAVADSTKVANYLKQITRISSNNFSDTFKPKSKADYKIKIEGNNMDDIVVKSYTDSLENKYHLHSSLNPDVFFESDSTGLFKSLFLNKEYFLLH